jgi:hypothetical protein
MCAGPFVGRFAHDDGLDDLSRPGKSCGHGRQDQGGQRISGLTAEAVK